MGFALRDDVYYCIANRKVVMLDLISNTLFCLPAATDAAFQQLAANAPPEGMTADLAPLVSRGFLIEAKGDGLRAPRPHPLMPLRDVSAASVPEGRLADTLMATCCQLFTVCDLRVRPIHTILASLRKRKASAIRQVDPLMDDHARQGLAAMLATRRLIATPGQVPALVDRNGAPPGALRRLSQTGLRNPHAAVRRPMPGFRRVTLS